MVARRRAFVVVACALMLICGPAFAVEVGPGGSFTIDNQPGEFVPPTGDVVASQDVPLTLTYIEGLPEGATVLDSNVFETTLRAQVLRDPLTQRLTFYYQVDAPSENAALSIDEGNVILNAFGAFATDVDAAGSWFGSRSDDGNTITAETTGIGAGESLQFAVATDATEFNSGGSARVFFQNTFAISNPAEPLQDQTTLAADVTTTGVFQPVTDVGPTPIPLPPAAWGGLLALAAAGTSVRSGLARRIY